MKRWRRIIINALTVLSLLLCIATAGMWVQSQYFSLQLAVVSPQKATGVVCWDGDIHFYHAEHYMGLFTHMGWFVLSPIDAALDPTAHYPYGFPLGVDGGGWFARSLHGVNWSGFTIPLWKGALIFACCFFLAVGAGRLPVWSSFKNWREKPCGFCVECGYDLRATPDRCPECGTVPVKVES